MSNWTFLECFLLVWIDILATAAPWAVTPSFFTAVHASILLLMLRHSLFSLSCLLHWFLQVGIWVLFGKELVVILAIGSPECSCVLLTLFSVVFDQALDIGHRISFLLNPLLLLSWVLILQVFGPMLVLSITFLTVKAGFSQLSFQIVLDLSLLVVWLTFLNQIKLSISSQNPLLTLLEWSLSTDLLSLYIYLPFSSLTSYFKSMAYSLYLSLALVIKSSCLLNSLASIWSRESSFHDFLTSLLSYC